MLRMLRGETQVVTVDYAGKAAPWNSISGATVQITARRDLRDAAPAWAALGAVQGTIAYAVVPAAAAPGSYDVTMTVILPTGEVDHTAELLEVKDHAFKDGDNPVVPTAPLSSILAQVQAAAATAVVAAVPALPSADPGAGSKRLWFDPADGNRVKFSP